VGVDGCRAGWVAVTRAGSDLQYEIFGTLSEMIAAHGSAERILIDIPIGLPWKAVPVRPCDTLARSVLGRPRGSSVFPPPCREAAHAPTPAEACKANVAVLERWLTKQTLAICPKIAEMDSFLLRERRTAASIREVHPEVCFWSLAGRRSMRHKKSTSAGRRERVHVLAHYEASSSELLERALSETRRVQLQADDILDALVALVTAEAPAGMLRSLVGQPGRDQHGLAMEMVYRDAT
jgi:predicted RNase H-like nuclease